MTQAAAGIDEKDWPIVFVDTHELMEAAGPDGMIDALDGLLKRGERFGLVLQGRGSRDDRDRSQAWLFERQDDLSRLVIGVAYLVAPATLARNRELIESHNPFPFPVWPCVSRDEGVDWLRGLGA